MVDGRAKSQCAAGRMAMEESDEGDEGDEGSSSCTRSDPQRALGRSRQ